MKNDMQIFKTVHFPALLDTRDQFYSIIHGTTLNLVIMELHMVSEK
jgi:hypothetical protein